MNFYKPGVPLPLLKEELPSHKRKNHPCRTQKEGDDIPTSQMDLLVSSGELESYVGYLSAKIYEIQIKSNYDDRSHISSLSNLTDKLRSRFPNYLRPIKNLKTRMNLNVTKCIVHLLLSLGCMMPIRAQEATESMQVNQITPLKAGDIVPDAVWKIPLKIVNHPEGMDTIRLSDYRENRFIIIDFWATWCTNCYAGLDSISSWVGKLPSTLFLSATTENKDKVLSAYKKREWNHIGVIEQNELQKYFPHKFVPHQVMILDGKVYGITDGSKITIDKIRKVLDGKSITIRQKIDNLEYDYKKDFLSSIVETAEAENIGRISNIYRYIDGIGEGQYLEQVGNYSKLTVTNSSLQKIHQAFVPKDYHHHILYDLKRPLHLKPSNDLKGGDFTDWHIKHAYSYELIASSKIKKEDLYAHALEEMNRYLGLKGEYKEIEVECYFIENIDKKTSIQGLSNPGTVRTIKFSNLIRYLNYRHPSDSIYLPLTAYVNKSDHPLEEMITLPQGFDYRNPKALSEHISRHGLKMVKGKTKKIYYVISDLNYEGKDVL